MIKIQIVEDGIVKYVTLDFLRELLQVEAQATELTPQVKAAITRAVKKATNETQ